MEEHRNTICTCGEEGDTSLGRISDTKSSWRLGQSGTTPWEDMPFIGRYDARYPRSMVC